MRRRLFLVIAGMTLLAVSPVAAADVDPQQDILVTFSNAGASSIGSGIRAPYRARKRYSISSEARRDANAVASEYALEEVDHWPIRALTVYCFVYRIPPGTDRDTILQALRADDRVESAQPVQTFETGIDLNKSIYNDTFVDLQHGLDTLGVELAHGVSRGKGVRIAIIDSNVDRRHEDLQGRIRRVTDFRPAGISDENGHGTAIASVIGANANNAIGIVGVAPEADLELLVACWSAENHHGAICDTFTLAKALDVLADNPPEILNMSITGPSDNLLGRLLGVLVGHGVVVVAADTAGPGETPGFPATAPGVISAGNAHLFADSPSLPSRSVFAPGNQIMVAIPSNAYELRSGSSLAAAHISGVIALLLSASPEIEVGNIASLLRQSHERHGGGIVSVDACKAMRLMRLSSQCPTGTALAHSEMNAGTQ